MRYRFIQAEKAVYPLTLLCRCLQVARSGFYVWQKQKPSKRAQENEVLLEQVKKIYQGSRKTYGSPRISAELRSQGQLVGKHRVARLLQGAGISALRKPRKRKTTDSNHAFPVAQNVLNRQFVVQKKNQVWVTDTTYLWTKEGWLYLAVIVDLYSRCVVGWATSIYHDRALVLSALTQALVKRVPEPGLLHHSDRGTQYASHDYQHK